ncbi:MAG: hypothetical protein QF805_13880 [Pirellulaceae bacterium]|nr:hypothetical protein [Pirellulaceae bacterium]
MAVVAASWLCGAVAGGLVTFVVVAPNDNENRRGGGIPTGPNGSPLVVEVEESGGGDNDRTPAAEGDMPWSPTERLVAAHLSELDRDQLAKEPPLMAGGYVRLRRTLHTSMRAPIHAKANSSVDQPRAGADGRPALSTDPDSLLRELLGADSDARL